MHKTNTYEAATSITHIHPPNNHHHHHHHHVAPIRLLQLWAQCHWAVFLPACWALCLLLSYSAITSLQSQVSVCVCVCASVHVCECVFSWLKGCVLRPAGLEQNQENILYDDMVSRKTRPELKPHHSKQRQFLSGHRDNKFNMNDWFFELEHSKAGFKTW